MNEPVYLKRFKGKSQSFRNCNPDKFLGNSNFIINGYATEQNRLKVSLFYF